MAISTRTSGEASRLLELLLMDSIQIMDVGDPVTVGTQVTRSLSAVGMPVPALVQQTSLDNAVESRTDSTWSVKVALNINLLAGQAIRVLACVADSSLAGQVLLLDKVSQGGLLRKGVAATFDVVNQEGKEVLS